MAKSSVRRPTSMCDFSRNLALMQFVHRTVNNTDLSNLLPKMVVNIIDDFYLQNGQRR